MEKFMYDVIAKYYQTQENQAAAIGNGDALATIDEDSVLVPVAQYSHKPSILGGDGKLKDFCGFLSQITSAKRTASLRRAGTDMWVMDIYDKVLAQVKEQSPTSTKPQAKTIAAELLLTALGYEWPANYKSQVSKSICAEAGLGDNVQDKTSIQNRDCTTLSRRLAYYRILKQLRLQECQFVGLAMVPRTETIFSHSISAKTWTHKLKWATFYKPMADLIEVRVTGDWSGKAELAAIFGEDDADAPAVDAWHNFNSLWNSIQDQEDYANMHPQIDLKSLPRAETQLERGFEGVADENATWSLWPRWIDGELVICASVPIKAPSFIGILPGTPKFDLDSVPEPGMYQGPEPGLHVNISTSVGLLSHLQRTREYAHGNVIAAWEPYADDLAPDHACMHLVLFAYRPVEPAQPLVLWEHMRVD
jgi:hypothetical protein